MPEPFPIIEVPLNAYELSENEPIGSKYKFWFHDKTLGRCIYKQATDNTGEDWTEKIAAELCTFLELPHAQYELAIFNEKRGTISPTFVPKDGSLITGNVILARSIPNYPTEQHYGVSQHTIDNIFNAIGDPLISLPINWKAPEGISNAIDSFVGYLLLDAWIGNSDRHHENWAFISLGDKTHLAPTYDHGSCLGRNETDDKRRNRLISKDRGFSVQAYVEKCNSALYAKVGDKKTLKTFGAFREVYQRYPDAANVWSNNLARVSSNDTLEAIYKV
ncbi:MAG: HipA-like protein, partial [Nostoc sp. TH1S01]|nr:HipA-like protein [Nostoc sp. TH1S01]